MSRRETHNAEQQFAEAENLLHKKQLSGFQKYFCSENISVATEDKEDCVSPITDVKVEGEEQEKHINFAAADVKYCSDDDYQEQDLYENGKVTPSVRSSTFLKQ